MKKLFSLSVIIFCFLVSGFAQTGYIINGNISNLNNNSKIYLIDGSQSKIIDSAVAKNGRFLLKGKLANAVHTYLYEGKSNKLADILLDNRQIFVTGSSPDYDSIKVNGSEIDSQWKEWYAEDQKLGYLKYQLNKVYQELLKNQDTTNTYKLNIIINQISDDRVIMLKKYVKKYKNTAAGAALPTLCLLQNQLTKADFLEMYNSLSKT
ncbi:DUF4369 domain-containing protein, partial [bacterium]